MRRLIMRNYIILLVIVVVLVLPLGAAQSVGTIQGKVSEEPGSMIIPGVLVTIMDMDFHTLSTEKGEYKFNSVPVGNYRVKFSHAGFGNIVKTDIIVRPNRITQLDVKMREELPWVKEEVTVEESYFHKDIEIPTSTFQISAEEIRRAPGTAGFVSRAITVLPGVSVAGGDENTDLLVRGGSPNENGFFIDNIEVPNPNHLPRLTSTGGAFSAINPELLQSIDFYSGAFSPEYGDFLSSVTNITLREGNRSEFDGEVDVNLLMAGTILEGPISRGKGSWLLAFRKSYVKLLNDIGILDEVGDTLDTIDSHLKVTYDFSSKQKLSIINFLATGSFRDFYGSNEDIIEDNFYTQNTSGINLKSIWSDSFFSNTSLSFSFLKRTDMESFTVTGRPSWWKCKDLARYYTLRNSNFLFFKNKNRLEFGVQIKYERDDINFYRHEYTTSTGEFYPTWTRDFNYNTTKSTMYLSFAWNLYKRFSTTIGLRGDYSSTHKVFHLSPRISGSIHLSKKLSINAGYGIFYQTIPMRFMTFYENHRHLKDTNAVHYNLGIEYISGGTKITVEAFEKRYKHLLIDPSNPLFLAAENGLDEYYYPPVLYDIGRGYARGVEMLIHKKLVKHFHGLFSLTIFKSRYTDLDGIWRNSTFETPFIINILAGYKPNSKWEFGLRYTVVGGKPYTPIDEELSNLYGTEIFDITRFNEERYPTYSKLNLRLERRFFFSRSNLVIYMDIWNALNKINVYEYNWGSDPDEHLPIMPVIGIKYEF